jgi:hypothetical protein
MSTGALRKRKTNPKLSVRENDEEEDNDWSGMTEDTLLTRLHEERSVGGRMNDSSRI